MTVEVATPICLDVKLVEKCRNFGNCCCNIDSVPESVKSQFDGNFHESEGINELFVSVGLFSVIRMERPVQIIVPASRFCLPERESTSANNSSDPCHVFGKLSFPIEEFFPFVGESGKCGERVERNDRLERGELSRNKGCCG